MPRVDMGHYLLIRDGISLLNNNLPSLFLSLELGAGRSGLFELLSTPPQGLEESHEQQHPQHHKHHEEREHG